MAAETPMATGTTTRPPASGSKPVLRAWPTCLIALCAVLLLAAGCAADGRDADDIAADGAAEVARHDDDPLTAAIGIDALTLIGDRRVLPASKNDDPGRVFGALGFSSTEFRWSYKVVDDVELEAALDLVVAELERRGATLSRSTGLFRELHAESAGDNLTITLQVLEPAFREIAHRITVTPSR